MKEREWGYVYVRGEEERMSSISHRCGRCVQDCCTCCKHAPVLLVGDDVQLLLVAGDCYLRVSVAQSHAQQWTWRQQQWMWKQQQWTKRQQQWTWRQQQWMWHKIEG